MYRFEKADKAMGMIYSINSESSKWIDEEMKLNMAFLGMQSAVGAVLTGLGYLLLA